MSPACGQIDCDVEVAVASPRLVTVRAKADVAPGLSPVDRVTVAAPPAPPAPHRGPRPPRPQRPKRTCAPSPATAVAQRPSTSR
ncbi:MAG: hypothetical protein R2873_08035 [Caldilineaceae bacterium]